MKLVRSYEFRVQSQKAKSTNSQLPTPSQSGFTLVELMVAISIVAILTTIGLAAYRSVLKDGRNAKRQADLRLIQSALEQYNNDQRFYPTSPLPAAGSALTNLTGRVLPSPAPSLKTYLNQLPSDPQTSNYIYQAYPSTPCTNDPADASSFCTQYCLYAKLETATVPTPAPSPCTLPAGYNLAITTP